MSLEEVKRIIDGEIAPLKLKIGELEKKIEDMHRATEFASMKYDQMMTNMQAINTQIDKQNTDLNSTKKNLKEISSLKDSFNKARTEIDDLGQYLRRNCVEISGISPTEETTSDEIVSALANDMGFNLDPTDISISHPLPTFNKKASSKIIVKFTRREVRNKFYANRQKVAGKKINNLHNLKTHLQHNQQTEKVYISESLTPLRKKLFGSVNNMRKKLHWKYIWTNNARIYIKQSDNSRTFTIDSFDEFDEFQKQHNKSPQH